MATGFTHQWSGQRVCFAPTAAAATLREELDRIDARRPMVIAGVQEAPVAALITDGLEVSLQWDEVIQHVPADSAARARQAADNAGVDVLVTIGGGSATGMGKAIALTSGLPLVSIPTTYAGSEATSVWGMTDDGHKSTGTDPRVLPQTVIYDSSLTLSLPVDLSIASGLNALAHCVDALWAPQADPINAALSLEGARALAQALPQIVARPTDIEARNAALYGCYLAGLGFAAAGSGMHHKICHVLGGALNLPHAPTHAVILPHVLAFNAAATSAVSARLAEVLGESTPTESANSAQAALDALLALYDRIDAPRNLGELGMHHEEVEVVVPTILEAIPTSNPAPADADSIRSLLHAAIDGDTPQIKEHS